VQMGNGWLQLTALAIFMFLTWKYKGLHQFDTPNFVLHANFLVSCSRYKGHSLITIFFLIFAGNTGSYLE